MGQQYNLLQVPPKILKYVFFAITEIIESCSESFTRISIDDN